MEKEILQYNKKKALLWEMGERERVYDDKTTHIGERYILSPLWQTDICKTDSEGTGYCGKW
jgi:hypothetical protein